MIDAALSRYRWDVLPYGPPRVHRYLADYRRCAQHRLFTDCRLRDRR